ncbi:MAG: ABC transporter substrate-binding protein [Alphaproteobacteria bacterium GM7ARS4]|nr:ABC transporter substrate-binding protein [Alphaproteobacteria bacterium GM7ARS4]
MSLRKIFGHACVLWVCFFLLGGAESEAGDSTGVEDESLRAAVAVVEDLHNTLIKSMKGGAGGADFVARYGFIKKAVERDFHLPLMASVIAGYFWRSASETDKTDFIEAFTEFTVTNYASNFMSYSGESFTTKKSFFLGDSRDRVRVNTALYREEKAPAILDYALRRFDGDWYIVDIFLDGRISELARRRSEYRSIDSEGIGLKALTAHLRRTSDENAEEAGGRVPRADGG